MADMQERLAFVREAWDRIETAHTGEEKQAIAMVAAAALSSLGVVKGSIKQCRCAGVTRSATRSRAADVFRSR